VPAHLPVPALDPADRGRVHAEQAGHSAHRQAAFQPHPADAAGNHHPWRYRQLQVDAIVVIAALIEMLLHSGQAGTAPPARAPVIAGAVGARRALPPFQFIPQRHVLRHIGGVRLISLRDKPPVGDVQPCPQVIVGQAA
jgi:hypothetical protein